MASRNITRFGFLDGSQGSDQDGNIVAIPTGHHEGWSYRQVGDALDSARASGFSGRTGVLIKDRLLAGLVSVAVMRHATCVPLDPGMTPSEIESRLDLLGITTVVTDDPNWQSPTVVSVVRVRAAENQLIWEGEAKPGQTSDDALVLMTSGSTGRPKIVPLSHANLIHSVQAIIDSLALTPADRAVNLLPMSHIGGLVDLLLVPLISGGSVVFGEARAPGAILALLASARPTWLQAAPAILRGLVQASPDRPSHHLRLIRSVSAPLSPALFEETASLFGVPVIEMYGMSETAGVITSNPLPPDLQKVGSVGKPVACQVRSREGGEIWVRSPGLFAGYQEKCDNEGLWDGEWFSTGDLGHFDEDGYLFLTGRTKEIINRGGQKVSPSEIDHLVESWSEIAEAAAFAFPHPTLGEEVGLALVLREDVELADPQIRERLSQHLADYKLPKRILRLERIPRNQNAKIQRFQLAGLAPPEAPVAPALSPTARRILPLWRAALDQETIDDQLDFFDQGGDSLSATTLLASVGKTFKTSLTGFIFYENATVRDLAAAVDERTAGKRRAVERDPDFPPRIRQKLQRFLSSWPGKPPFEGSYARLDDQADPEHPRLFWCCNAIGEVLNIAENTRDILSVVALRSLRSIQHKKLRNYPLLTSIYCEEVERSQPAGPLLLGGFCEGGRIMTRVGRELIRRGREVHLLVLQDHNLEEPFPAQIALIHSESWKRHPVKRHHDIRHGWQKLYEGRFGVMEKESSHARTFTGKDRERVGQFFKDQVALSRNTPAVPATRQDPRCSVTLVSKLPFLLRPGQPYRVQVRIENRGDHPLIANDGVVLHARWFDLNHDPKPGIPMYVPLASDLAPGKTQELEIDLISHKGKRLYQIQIAVIEEGWGWTPAVLQDSHRHWHLIL